MKRSILNTAMVLMGVMFCVAVSLTACGNRNEQSAVADQYEPDSTFAIIDSLAVFMVQDIVNIDTPEDFVSRYESQSDAIKSYWMLNHEGEDENTMKETVVNELKTLAGKLSEGSTMDMMLSGELTCAIAQYLTAQDYCKSYSNNPLYQAEMRDWILLEKEFGQFYGNVANLANWGGTISNVIAGHSLSFLADARQADYSQLKKDGNFADSEGMNVAEARANLIQELADAKSLEDDLSAGEDYKKTLNDMRERADKIVVLLDKWLASREELCKAESIPDNHTARLVAQLGNHIMELIEG